MLTISIHMVIFRSTHHTMENWGTSLSELAKYSKFQKVKTIRYQSIVSSIDFDNNQLLFATAEMSQVKTIIDLLWNLRVLYIIQYKMSNVPAIFHQYLTTIFCKTNWHFAVMMVVWWCLMCTQGQLLDNGKTIKADVGPSTAIMLTLKLLQVLQMILQSRHGQLILYCCCSHRCYRLCC